MVLSSCENYGCFQSCPAVTSQTLSFVLSYSVRKEGYLLSSFSSCMNSSASLSISCIHIWSFSVLFTSCPDYYHHLCFPLLCVSKIYSHFNFFFFLQSLVLSSLTSFSLCPLIITVFMPGRTAFNMHNYNLFYFSFLPPSQLPASSYTLSVVYFLSYKIWAPWLFSAFCVVSLDNILISSSIHTLLNSASPSYDNKCMTQVRRVKTGFFQETWHGSVKTFHLRSCWIFETCFKLKIGSVMVTV